MDAQLFLWLYERLHRPPWAELFEHLTHLGDYPVVLKLAVLGGLESLLAWVPIFRRRRRPLIAPWVAVPVAVWITGWLKSAVGRPRPAEWYPELGLFVAEAGRSFPSGHATAAFALATALSLRWPRASGVGLLLATLVALSRVALGLHWPSDVVAGALIGVSVVAILGWLERRLRSFKRT